jgi:hypothetical protein
MTNLIRAAFRPRVRPILLTTAGATLLCAAFVLGRSVSRSEIVVTPRVIVPAPQVTVAPAPVVMPPTPVVVQAPTPPEPPPAPPAPQPRAQVPMLDAGCVMNLPGSTANPTCAWDDGFPAISADGALIATKYAPTMGGSDLYGLSIHLIDTKTSRVVRDSVILTPTNWPRSSTRRAQPWAGRSMTSSCSNTSACCPTIAQCEAHLVERERGSDR